MLPFHANIVVHYQALPDAVRLPDGALVLRRHASGLAGGLEGSRFADAVFPPPTPNDPTMFSTSVQVQLSPVELYRPFGPRLWLTGTIPPICRTGFEAKFKAFLVGWLALHGPLGKKTASLRDERGVLRVEFAFAFTDGCHGRLDLPPGGEPT